MLAEPDLEPPIATAAPDLAAVARHLSHRLTQAQRSIRPLEAIAWDADIERRFLAANGRELPAVTRDYYRSRPLPFDPGAKLAEFASLETDVRDVLGSRSGVGRILTRMCREYAGVVRMLSHRGTPTFARISARLYGSPDGVEDGLRALEAMARLFPHRDHGPVPRFDADQAAAELARRLGPCFPDWPGLRVQLAGGLLANAAAGCGYLKLRAGNTFSAADLRLLEVHEGWVHLATTYNARQQAACAFLRKGPPSSTRTQEGLAVLTEFLTGAASPERVRRLRQRVRAIQMAAAGADFCQVYRDFLDADGDEREAYQQTVRVFRGSLPAGCGPFTKDLCYVSGLGAVLNWFMSAARLGRAEQIRLLFCGKVAVEDVPVLATLERRGVLSAPAFVPPPFQDAAQLLQRLKNGGD